MAYKVDSNARFAKTHDWARMEDGMAVCGISDYAQHALSDVVYVELPEVGATYQQGDVYATVESVKAAEEVYAPVTGEVVAVNELLVDTPELLNTDPYGEAWIIKVRPADLAELESLMEASAYEAFVQDLEEKGAH